MLLFLRNIPSGSTRDELKQFVRLTIRTSWMARLLYHPKVEKADILKIKHNGSNNWEHHGLVRISPSNAASMVMHMLRQRRFRGRALQVRPYQSRRLHDRRRAYTDPALLEFNERRKSDRRRDLQITTTRPSLRRSDPAPALRGDDWRRRQRAKSAGQATKNGQNPTRPVRQA